MDKSITIKQDQVQSALDDLNQPDAPTRREFLKLAMILSGSAFLLVNRFGTREELLFPLNQGATYIPKQDIPQGFKRFVITQGGPHIDLQEPRYVGYGSQCPDLACAMLWVDQTEFQFFNDVQTIEDLYTQDGYTELHWLD